VLDLSRSKAMARVDVVPWSMAMRAVGKLVPGMAALPR
jgi:hypothetical protein